MQHVTTELSDGKGRIVSKHLTLPSYYNNTLLVFSELLQTQTQTQTPSLSISLSIYLSLTLNSRSILSLIHWDQVSLAVVVVLSDGYALPLFSHLPHHRNHHHQLLPPQALELQQHTNLINLNLIHGPLRSNKIESQPMNHMANTFQTSPHSLFLPSPFMASRSMVSFEGTSKSTSSLFHPFDLDENNGEECMEDYFHHPEKKRRLSASQVQFLEKSFEEENKLEPDRKTKLAKDLGLQPRQVAIWFQNRRARWKTKQLEKDYETLHASFHALKANYDILLKEKDNLQTQVANLTEKVLARGKQGESETKGCDETSSKCEGSKVCSVAGGNCKQEDISSARSDILDSESPHYTDGEPGDCSYVFEPDQSDVSQDEEDNLSKNMYPSYLFPKLEDVDYSDPAESSCNFGFPEEDHALWTWAY